MALPTLAALAAAPGQRTGDSIGEIRRAHYSIADASASENGTLTFTITRSGDTSKIIVVPATLGNGTAISGVDYKRPAIVGAFFGPGQTTATIEIKAIAGPEVKPARTFTVTLARAPGSGTLDRAEATGTILADRPPPPPPPPPRPTPSLPPPPPPQSTPSPATLPRQVYAIEDATAREGEPLTFTVRRGGAIGRPGIATVRITGGDAVAGRDYRSGDFTARFAPRSDMAVVTIDTIARDGAQPTRLLVADLVNLPAGATMVRRPARGTITDVPTPPAPVPTVTATPTPAPPASATPTTTLTPTPTPAPRPTFDPTPTPPPPCQDGSADCDAKDAWWNKLDSWQIGALIAVLLAAIAAAARLILYPRPRIDAAIDPTAHVLGELALMLPDLTVDATIGPAASRASAMTVEELPDD